jgi:arginyl-tRNA synthetase
MLNAPEEREILLLLSSLTDEIVAAAQNYDPARITRFCTELAGLFHKFYNACHIKGEAEPLLQARLTLCAAVQGTLASLLRMFKINAPEQM